MFMFTSFLRWGKEIKKRKKRIIYYILQPGQAEEVSE